MGVFSVQGWKETAAPGNVIFQYFSLHIQKDISYHDQKTHVYIRLWSNTWTEFSRNNTIHDTLYFPFHSTHPIPIQYISLKKYHFPP